MMPSNAELSTASSHSMLLVSSCRACASAKRGGMPRSSLVFDIFMASSAKLKSANIFVHAGFGQSAKFNSRLYSSSVVHAHLSVCMFMFAHAQGEIL